MHIETVVAIVGFMRRENPTLYVAISKNVYAGAVAKYRLIANLTMITKDDVLAYIAYTTSSATDIFYLPSSG